MGMRLTAGSLALVAAAFACPACAAPCEDNFTVQGAFMAPQQFSSYVTIAGGTIPLAFSQLRTIFAENGIRILSEDRVHGTLSAELPKAPFIPSQPITAQFSSNKGWGTVRLVNTTQNGVTVTQSKMKRRVCGILNRLTDPSGRSPFSGPMAPVQTAQANMVRPVAPKARLAPVQSPAAPPQRQARPATQSTAPPQPSFKVIESTELAQQIKTARDNPARINTVYHDQNYRLSGLITRIDETRKGYSVIFEGVSVDTGRLDLEPKTTLQIICHVPLANARSAAVLYPKQRGTLTGRFDRVENHSLLPTISLEECK